MQQFTEHKLSKEIIFHVSQVRPGISLWFCSQLNPVRNKLEVLLARYGLLLILSKEILTKKTVIKKGTVLSHNWK